MDMLNGIFNINTILINCLFFLGLKKKTSVSLLRIFKKIVISYNTSQPQFPLPSLLPIMFWSYSPLQFFTLLPPNFVFISF